MCESAHLWEDVIDTKRERDFELFRRKMRKSRPLKIVKAFFDWDRRAYRSWKEEAKVNAWRDAVRWKRPHMTMRVKGGWDVRLEDDGEVATAEDKEQDMDGGAVLTRRMPREVPLAEMVKPGKARKLRLTSMCIVHSHRITSPIVSDISPKMTSR
jgi:hypothetical protein